jgi:hypothetical protein
MTGVQGPGNKNPKQSGLHDRTHPGEGKEQHFIGEGSLSNRTVKERM